MKSLKKICLIATSIACICAAPIKHNCALNNDYAVTIHGTSNLHSWDEKVETIAGEGSVNLNDDGSCDVNSITIKMEVHSIKSDMGRIMNNNTYKALKADENPQIIFKLNTPAKSIKINGTKNSFPLKGSLTIAGVTRPLNVTVKIIMPEKGKLIFEGAQTIKMTDFGVTPPTALLGTLKTGDAITINFKTNFEIK